MSISQNRDPIPYENTRTKARVFSYSGDGKLISAATVTAIAAAVSAAITAAETAFAARWAITLRTRERDRERTPVHLLTVPTVDSRLRFRFGSHLNEAEAARTARHTIANDACGNDRAGLAESLFQIVFRRAIGNTAYVKLIPLYRCS